MFIIVPWLVYALLLWASIMLENKLYSNDKRSRLFKSLKTAGNRKRNFWNALCERARKGPFSSFWCVNITHYLWPLMFKDAPLRINFNASCVSVIRSYGVVNKLIILWRGKFTGYWKKANLIYFLVTTYSKQLWHKKVVLFYLYFL